MERTRWLLQLTALGAGWQQVDMIQCEGERNTGGKGEQTGNEKDATVQPKRWRLLFLLCYYFSDLPCMHLDPGVNRLGLNITSVHQTDSRPVTPDIVFPICVILWSQEDGLKKKTQQNKKVNTFHIYSRTHTHASRIREASVSSLPWGKLGKKSDWLQNSKPCKWKRKRAVSTAKLHSQRAEHLWEVKTADLEDSFGVTLEGLYTLKTNTTARCDYSCLWLLSWLKYLPFQDVTEV